MQETKLHNKSVGNLSFARSAIKAFALPISVERATQKPTPVYANHRPDVVSVRHNLHTYKGIYRCKILDRD